MQAHACNVLLVYNARLCMHMGLCMTAISILPEASLVYSESLLEQWGLSSCLPEASLVYSKSLLKQWGLSSCLPEASLVYSESLLEQWGMAETLEEGADRRLSKD